MSPKTTPMDPIAKAKKPLCLPTVCGPSMPPLGVTSSGLSDAVPFSSRPIRSLNAIFRVELASPHPSGSRA